MTASNAAVDKAATQKDGVDRVGPDKAGPDKVLEKVAEKRRALGRGLESLLPGPRVVPAAVASTQDAFTPLTPSTAAASSSEFSGAPAGTPVAPLHPLAETAAIVDELQAVASGKTADGETVFLVGIDVVDHNPYQTRKEFDASALAELRDSIRVQGVLQPIVVRPGKAGRFILILGERRLRASSMAGKTTIPAIVKRVSDQQAAEMTLVENLQREDLFCLEQAGAFAMLSREFQLTQEEIGKRVGVSRQQVSNYLRLLNLPIDVYTALAKGHLTYSHARALLSLDNDAQISKIAQLVIRRKMSVVALEDMVTDIKVPIGNLEERKPSGARWVDPNVRAAQRSIESVLGMRVRIKDRKGKGKITIEYGTLDDFDRVVGMLKGLQ